MANLSHFLIATTLSLSFACTAVHADATRGQVASFKQLMAQVQSIGEPTTTLLVMDDDDTLTMMRCDGPKPADACQYLGGPAWYDWQSDLLKDQSGQKTNTGHRVAEDQQQLLVIAALLLALNDMPYTETELPQALHALTKTGVRLMVETARGGSTISATEAQFTQLPVKDSPYHSFLQLISSNAPHFGPDKLASLAGPFIPCAIPGSREVSYRQGVMYVAGQNKGTMLQCLLSRYQASGETASPVRNIVFIDDTQANVNDVYLAFMNDPNYNVRALHYDALDKHKAALSKEPMLQDRAARRWTAIRDTLKSELLEPAIGD